jgi:hypothetical protein
MVVKISLRLLGFGSCSFVNRSLYAKTRHIVYDNDDDDNNNNNNNNNNNRYFSSFHRLYFGTNYRLTPGCHGGRSFAKIQDSYGDGYEVYCLVSW